MQSPQTVDDFSNLHILLKLSECSLMRNINIIGDTNAQGERNKQHRQELIRL